MIKKIIIIILTTIATSSSLIAQYEYRGEVYYSYDENITVYLEASYESRKAKEKENYVYSLLKVYEETDKGSLELISKELSNDSNMFSYKFAVDFKKNTKKFLVIQGRYEFWILNVRNKKLSGPHSPRFWGIGSDSQSGMISDLKIYTDGLFIYGVSVDNGGFLYDICDIDNPIEKLSANLPFLSTGRLFELKNYETDTYNGVYITDESNTVFLNILYSNKKLIPIDNSEILNYSEEKKEDIIMNTTMAKNRYIISKEMNENKVNFIVVDIFTGNIINLPKEKDFNDRQSIINFLEQ